MPAHVEDREGECFGHSVEVITRAITRRERKVLSTLDGKQWHNQKAGEGDYKFWLKCPRADICSGTHLVSIYAFKNKDGSNDHHFYCCTACSDYFKREAKRAGLVGTLKKIPQKKYVTYDKDYWKAPLVVAKSLVSHEVHNRAPKRKPTVTNRAPKRKPTVTKASKDIQPKQKQKKEDPLTPLQRESLTPTQQALVLVGKAQTLLDLALDVLYKSSE